MNTVLSVNQVRELHRLAEQCGINIEKGVELVWVRSACKPNLEAHVADNWSIDTCDPCADINYDYTNLAPALTLGNLLDIMRSLSDGVMYNAFEHGGQWKAVAHGFNVHGEEYCLDDFFWNDDSITIATFKTLCNILNTMCDEQGEA